MSGATHPPFKTKWDTSCVQDRERFSYFREGVCQAFFAYTPLPPADGIVDARIDAAVVHSGLISRIATTPMQVTRTALDFSKIPGDLFSLSYTSTGGLDGIAAGVPFVQTADHMSLGSVDALESFNLRNPYSVIALIFDKSLLQNVALDGKVLVLSSADHSPLRSCIRLISERLDSGSQEELDCLMRASICLLAASLIRDPDFLEDKGANDASSRGILVAIKDFVRHHIRNEALTTSRVAEHFGMSPRYVQKVFAADNTTLKSYVMRMRLEHVARDLADPCIARASVADIAERWGFRDMATFHRNFRRHFDDTPKQMRMRSRSSEAPHS